MEVEEPRTEMTEDEIAEKIASLVGTTPIPDEKQNVYSFLNNIAIADDTTKLGYLKEEEIGMPALPLRTDKSLALWSGEVMENSFFEKFFNAEAEITTSTSLSKDGFLAKLAILQKKEIADVTKPKKTNKGWFKPKEKEDESNV